MDSVVAPIPGRIRFATIAPHICIASACAAFAIYFDLTPHAPHRGSIVNSSAGYELS